MVRASSRTWVSDMPLPSSSRAASMASSREVLPPPHPPAAARRRPPAIRPYTTPSRSATAFANAALPGVGSHSGRAAPAPLLANAANAASVAAATRAASAGPRPSPNRAAVTTRRVRALKSGYTSLGPAGCGPPAQRTPPNDAAAMSAIAAPYASTAALRNAGAASWRCRLQDGPSDVSRPSPVRRDDGKKAVPA